MRPFLTGDRGGADRRPDHRTGASRGSFLEFYADAGVMNARALPPHLARAADEACDRVRRPRHLGRSSCLSSTRKFGSQFRAVIDSGIFPEQFTRLGGGDIFSLPGSIALSFIHPIAIILTSVFAVGFSAGAIAGERQRGTLEVVLARPISRRGFYLTILAAVFGFIAVSVAALLAGGLAGVRICRRNRRAHPPLRAAPLAERRALVRIVRRRGARGLGLLRSAAAGTGRDDRRRRGDVLLRDPRLAVAGCRAAPAGPRCFTI